VRNVSRCRSTTYTRILLDLGEFARQSARVAAFMIHGSLPPGRLGLWTELFKDDTGLGGTVGRDERLDLGVRHGDLLVLLDERLALETVALFIEGGFEGRAANDLARAAGVPCDDVVVGGCFHVKLNFNPLHFCQCLDTLLP